MRKENLFQNWNDIDYLVDIARENPDKLFEKNSCTNKKDIYRTNEGDKQICLGK